MFNRIIISSMVVFGMTALCPLAAEARPTDSQSVVIARSASDEAISKKSRTERPLSLMITNKSIEVRPGDPSQGTIGYQQSIRVVGIPFKKSHLSLQNRELDSARGSLRNLLIPGVLSEMVDDEGGLMEQSLACNREATVRVLAREITYGPTGPLVPVRMDYQMGQGGPKTGVGGGDLEMGVDYTFNYGFGGEELILWGKMAYPSFAEPNMFDEVPSDHLNNAAILENGVNLEQVLIDKQAQGPYGTQIDLTEILNDPINPNSETDYLDDNGNIRLPENEFIVLYELGTRDQQSPAFDFNDLVLKVKTDCGVGSEVMLRDSIGGDNSSTNGNYAFSTYKIMPNGFWAVAPITFTTQQNMTLKSFRIIVGRMTPNLNWANLTFKIMVWSSQADAIASPQNGNVANVNFPALQSPPPQYGETGNPGPPLGITQTYNLSFDLNTSGIQIPAGQTRTIALRIHTPGATSGGFLGAMESTEAGISDIQLGSSIPGGWHVVSETGGSFHDGRYGIELIGTSN